MPKSMKRVNIEEVLIYSLDDVYPDPKIGESVLSFVGRRPNDGECLEVTLKLTPDDLAWLGGWVAARFRETTRKLEAARTQASSGFAK